ncbi:hypothetical protein AB0G74_27680 [Streptomyces sp. NPDC020875]|uniref:hypothetical protein n=1 Tax=Streptomyces sp. NPDC020875 TaxID=3154898 RepID=UPI00340DE707
MAARTATRSRTKKAAARTPPVKKKATAPVAPRRSPEAAAGTAAAVEARIADARDRAADIADLAADRLAEARMAAAEEAAELTRQAGKAAEEIRIAAAADAERALAAAAAEAGDLIRGAARHAETVRAEAEEAARAEAGNREQLLADAEARVGGVLAEAEERAAELVALRRASAEGAYRTALEDAARIVAGAQEQAAEARIARVSLETELELARRRSMLDLDEDLAVRRGEIRDRLSAYREEAEEVRAQTEASFRALGEEHERQRQGQRAALAAELEEMRANAEAAARAAAREIVAGAEGQKADLVAETRAALERAKAREAEAKRQLGQARAADRRRARRASTSDRLWRGAPWVALAAGVGLAASGEYELARLVGFHPYVAPLFPLSVDIYAVVAFKKKRDVRPALSIMAASNLAYHLAERGGVHDPSHPYGDAIVLGLTTVVVLTFVVIIWRVHRLLDGDHPAAPGTAPDRTAAGDPAPVREEPCRTDGEEPVRPDAAEPVRTDRTDGARTAPVRPDRTGRTAGARTAPVRPDGTDRTDKSRTDGARTDRTDKPRPARTDDEALAVLRKLPRTDSGFVTVNAARTAVGCNRDRAVRLLGTARLLSPADAAKHLTPTTP